MIRNLSNQELEKIAQQPWLLFVADAILSENDVLQQSSALEATWYVNVCTALGTSVDVLEILEQGMSSAKRIYGLAFTVLDYATSPNEFSQH